MITTVQWVLFFLFKHNIFHLFQQLIFSYTKYAKNIVMFAGCYFMPMPVYVFNISVCFNKYLKLKCEIFWVCHSWPPRGKDPANCSQQTKQIPACSSYHLFAKRCAGFSTIQSAEEWHPIAYSDSERSGLHHLANIYK